MRCTSSQPLALHHWMQDVTWEPCPSKVGYGADQTQVARDQASGSLPIHAAAGGMGLPSWAQFVQDSERPGRAGVCTQDAVPLGWHS